MFKYLKEKLGKTLSKIGKSVEEEKEEILEEDIEELKEEIQNIEEEPTNKPKEPSSEKLEFEEKPEKKGFLGKVSESITKFTLKEDKFEDLFWELELILLENNVAVEIIDKIKEDLKKEIVGTKLARKNPQQIINDTIRKSIDEILTHEEIDIIKNAKTHKPYVIAIIGVNGSGKTTTLAKLANYFKKNNLSVVVAASDTFRAAAIHQLEEHTTKLGIKLIKHDYKSDPAAVAYDAVKHAKAKNIDVVLIDTAGRLHTNDNLMQELQKIMRVNEPDLKIFVGESITGNDCIEQARIYNEKIGIDAIILTKVDIDEKGGAALSVSHITKKPVIFIGSGQKYEDLKKFDKEEIIKNLGL